MNFKLTIQFNSLITENDQKAKFGKYICCLVVTWNFSASDNNNLLSLQLHDQKSGVDHL